MSKIFLTLTILCIFGAALVQGFDKKEAIAKFMAKANECKTEVGAKEADIEELVGKKPASSKEGKCLRSCLMKKYEVMDSYGKFVKTVAVGFAEKYTEGAADKMKIANEMIDTCAATVVPADHCEAAELYGKCFKEQADAHGIKENFSF